jgi:hypothetical protein
LELLEEENGGDNDQDMSQRAIGIIITIIIIMNKRYVRTGSFHKLCNFSFIFR